MDQNTYNQHTLDYQKLTGKRASDDLAAFFSYLNLIALMDLKDLLKKR